VNVRCSSKFPPAAELILVIFLLGGFSGRFGGYGYGHGGIGIVGVILIILVVLLLMVGFSHFRFVPNSGHVAVPQ
jgi:hypothetical protein